MRVEFERRKQSSLKRCALGERLDNLSAGNRGAKLGANRSRYPASPWQLNGRRAIVVEIGEAGNEQLTTNVAMRNWQRN